MSRWSNSTNETEAAKSSLTVVILANLDFAGGAVRAHTSVGELTHGGNTYYGLGHFGGIELDPEDQDVAARGARLTLSGIPADLVPDILTETAYQGRVATLYIGFIESDTGAWVATAEELWSGYMDYMDLQYSGSEARVTLHIEDELRREPIQAWYTDEDQQLRFSGDKFFNDLPNVETHRAAWGVKQVGYRTSASAIGAIASRVIRTVKV